jgi:lambda family phage portal protein
MMKFWRRNKQAAAPAGDAAAGGALAEVQSKPRRTLLGRTLAGLFKGGETNALDRWTTAPVTPDLMISVRLPTLVARSREQWSNNDYVRGFIRLVRQNVVGPLGVTMQAKATTPRGKLDTDLNAALESDWDDWGAPGNCDVTGQLSWREIQALAVETTARDGEFIIREVYGQDAGPHGFALQMIDTQRLPVTHNNPQLAGGGFIRHSIEYNRFGRAVAYHFTSTDEFDSSYYSYGGTGYVRVPADQIIHGFIHEMVGQKRGLPWTSTGLFRLHHLQGFEDAAVQNARAGASKMGFIQYKDGFGPEADDDTPLHIEAEPLSFQELPEGAELAEFNPLYPSGEFAVFNKAMLRGAATGWGVPYNEVANDLEGVNFSSIRQMTLDAREHYKEIQQWLIEHLVMRVYADWIKYRLLSSGLVSKGRPVPADKLRACMQVAWQPRRWTWIDPRADVDSALDAIRGGLTSISQVIREQGRDPETVFQEFAADLVAMKAAGIPDEIIALFLLGQPPTPRQPAAPNEAKE